MLVRGAARVRADVVQPSTLRLSGDVQVAAQREPYARFFAVEEYDLSFRRFDGSPSPTVTRAVFISGDAVTVLPYDPVRDRVLVVEQFRSGPYARGDSQPWQIEAIAGRIDTGETPEDAARREAVEEAGLTLGALLSVAQYYPTPGICAEYLYSYVAVTDLPDGSAGVFGVEGEAEDIRGHLIGFDALMALISSGEVSNAPLILTAFWLHARRAELRGG
jgi:nudix-type nucleoside diphosphatase (YffH/AdpP family)